MSSTSSTLTCKCGGTEIDTDRARGNSVCTSCGSVVEDNFIVSEVQFEEGGHGGASAIGQFVSADGKASGSNLGGTFHPGMSKESRQVTLENGRRKIVDLSQQLRLNAHCCDMAFNFFKMAVARRLTRGRKSTHVTAACVYMACRSEGTPHMLLDFSDILHVNVYDLGKTYMKLSADLCINIPAIDPCLYIVRFAHRLEFKDDTHQVSMTALRLVARMKRDWMHTGRRPSGLCGAALLVAARLHDYNRTPRDIVKVVKVCEATLRKRLSEFGQTPSSKLTTDEFMNIDLEEEQDPPAYKLARDKKIKDKLSEEGATGEVADEIVTLQQTIEKELEERRTKIRGMYAKFSKERAFDECASTDDDADSDISSVVTVSTMGVLKDILPDGEMDFPEDANDALSLIGNLDEDRKRMPPPASAAKRAKVEPITPTAASLGLIRGSLEDLAKARDQTELVDCDEIQGDGELDLTGIDDDEIDKYIMTDKEVVRKSEIWHRINAQYLLEQREKQVKLAKEAEENVNKPEKKKRKSTRKKNPNAAPASSASEALEKMLQEKKLSSKINYEVLRNLCGTPSSTSDAGSSICGILGDSSPPRSSNVSECGSLSSCASSSVSPSVSPVKRARTTSSSSHNSFVKSPKRLRAQPNVSKSRSSSISDESEAPAKVVVDVEKDSVADQDDFDEFDGQDEDCDSELSAFQLMKQHRGETENEFEDDF